MPTNKINSPYTLLASMSYPVLEEHNLNIYDVSFL